MLYVKLWRDFRVVVRLYYFTGRRGLKSGYSELEFMAVIGIVNDFEVEDMG